MRLQLFEGALRNPQKLNERTSVFPAIFAATEADDRRTCDIIP
jgi:hypothetical protein